MTKPAILAIVGSLLLALGATGDTLAEGQSTRPVVRVSVERFSFTPSEIKLQVGDEVEIRLTSQDTDHGFRLVGSDTDIVIPKRGAGEASVVYRADTEGRFAFECSRMCGAGHNFMRGVIVVRPRTVDGAE
jgi:cytochrome c oxidase subunit 2